MTGFEESATVEGMPRPLILVIDDEHGFRAIMSHVLASGGYNAATAVDGADGLRQFAERELDLVVLDGHLPDICRTSTAVRWSESCVRIRRRAH